MKLTKPVILLVNLVIILIGVILVLVGVSLDPGIPKALCEAIGTGLIAVGGVNALDRLLTQETTPEGIKIIALARTDIPSDVRNRKYHASKVDIVGVSLTGCLQEIVNDPQQTMIHRVLFHHTRLRLLFVHPKASFITQRALEDSISKDALIERQKKSVERCVQFYMRLRERYEAAMSTEAIDLKTMGSVEIKLIDFCPYITIDRADDYIYWGLYTSHTSGMHLPMYLATQDQNYSMYDHLKKHFDSLREKDLSSSDHFLVKMVLSEPTLNHKLAEDILGSERLQAILSGQPA